MRPRRTISQRILLSFAAVLLAFAVTLGFGVRALWHTQRDAERLSGLLVPAALQLGQLRATQATLASLVDGVSDEREPSATRHVLSTLSSERTARLDELQRTLAVLRGEPGELGELGAQLEARLADVRRLLARDAALLEALYAALSAHRDEELARVLVELGAVEHDGAHALRGMAGHVNEVIRTLRVQGRERVTFSLVALFLLSAATLGLGLFLSMRTRQWLRPLASLRARVRAVAAGDRTPHTPSSDNGTEIAELELGFEQMVGALGDEQSRRLSNERFVAIGKMAAHVTHEIRNPLNSIGLNLELLEEELPQDGGDSSAELLRAVRREVERLEALSEEYLRLARLPSPRKEPGDLLQLVQRVLEFEAAEQKRLGVEATLHAPADLPTLDFDESQLRQALLNLLRNAREAMPHGGRLDLDLRLRGLSLWLQIADRGSGIPAPILARVFDPFFSTKGEGTGLGLAITKQIVEAHGGHIHYRERDGGGSVFELELPLRPER